MSDVKRPPLPETASQTAGPYVHIGLMPIMAGIRAFGADFGGEIAGPDVPGTRISVEGRIFDGTGALVKDAVIEVAQHDAEGRLPGDPNTHPQFTGWGRVATDFDTGLWRVETIMPRPLGAEAPHLAFWIVARGINVGLHTRVYFGDCRAENAASPVFQSVPEERRITLIADKHTDTYYHDIVLQGPAETVFFDV